MAGATTAATLVGAIGDAVAYPETTPLNQVSILNEVLDPLKSEIPNYDSLRLVDFLANNPYAIQGQTFIGNNTPDVAYYVFKKVKPIWRPVDNFTDPTVGSAGGPTTIGYFGDSIIVEGSGSDFQEQYQGTDSQHNTITNTYMKFYIGKASSSSNLFGTVVPPRTAPLTISIPNTQTIFVKNYVAPIAYENYVPPATANVSRYDYNRLNITEQQVLGAGFLYYNNWRLLKSNFDAVFNNLYPITSLDQPGPFFSATYTIPNIDMAAPTLSIGQGLQGFTISIGEGGIRTNYTLGTEKMRLRNPDIFIRYYYDNSVNKYLLYFLPKSLLIGYSNWA